MSSMLADVITGGTAHRRAGRRVQLPAAGKTGTTDDYADAWFIGYTPHLVTGVWFGLDTARADHGRAASRHGGGAGLGGVHEGRRPRGDKADWFRQPADVEKIAVCRLSGARARALVPLSLRAGRDRAVAGRHGRDVDAGPGMLPSEPPVYEDLFAVGTVSSQLCPLQLSGGVH